MNFNHASGILGNKCVISNKEHAGAWGLSDTVIDDNFPVRYTEETIRQCAEENKLYDAGWYLSCLGGYSFVRQIELKEEKFNSKSVESIKGETRLLQERGKREEDYWIERGFQAGYTLIKTNGVLGGMSQQEMKYALLDFNRKKLCWEEVLAELIITILVVKRKKICHDWIHLGRFYNSFRHVVTVALHDNVLVVDSVWSEHLRNPNLQTALFWSYDF